MQEIYTPEELASRFKIKAQTIYRWLNKGIVRGRKIGGLWRIPGEELVRLMSDIGTEKTSA